MNNQRFRLPFLPLSVAIGALVLSSCAVEPRPLDYGLDACHYCMMTVVDQQHGAEAVTSKGKIRPFDAVECLVGHLADQDASDFAFLLVNDYEQPGALVDATSCTYLISEALPSPMGANLTAFASAESAAAAREAKGGALYTWDELVLHLAR